MIEEPDFNPEDEQQVDRALGGEFSRPAEKFRGADLWPFTPGSKDIFAMVTDPADSILYRALAFVYVHVRRGGPDMEQDLARHIIPLAWNDLNVFRAKVFAFRNELTDADLERVYEIGRKELNLEALSQIVASPPDIGASPKKKDEVTSRRKLAGKSTRPRKK